MAISNGFPRTCKRRRRRPTTPRLCPRLQTLQRRRHSISLAGRPIGSRSIKQPSWRCSTVANIRIDAKISILCALPVTLERFSFATQIFAASEATRDYAGSGGPNGSANNWSVNSGAGMSKVLPTGALLLLNFSNQVVFNFLNPKSAISTNSINFSAVQPLLRGGGQAVALESLTLTERNLLYQIRSFARFRKELYVEIASNSGGSISGSSFQPTGVLANAGGGISGLSGSGLNPGIISTAMNNLNAPIIAPAAPGQLFLSGAITPPPSGYLNTMLESIQIYIDKENIAILNTILQRYRGLQEGDIVGPLQLQSVEQQLLSGRSNLLNDQQQYLDAIDNFKLAIGVPTNLNIEMDDSVLRPLMKQFRRSRAIIEEEQVSVMEASNLIAPAKTPRVRAELLQLFQTSTFVRGTQFAAHIRGKVAVWEKLSDQELANRLEELRKETQEILNRQAEGQRNDQSPVLKDQIRLKELGSQSDIGNFERVLRKYERAYLKDGAPVKTDPVLERKRITQFRDVISLWQKILVDARDERWNNIRQLWPDLPRCCVDGVDLVRDDLTKSEATAAQHALSNRLDLMNVRGQVVDAWRQLAVFANALLGTFNVGYQYNGVTNHGGFGSPTGPGGANQLTINAQLPLVRIQERNNYRACLIGYQRQRRALQEAEDLAVRLVRSEIHLLRVYAESYRIQQRQLELAYLTIDSSLEALQAPTPPGQARGGDGPAALTQQLLAAQRSLPAAQNALLTIWINYLNARLQLYRDLELMPIDARGVWIDEIRDCDCSLNAAPAAGSERRAEPQRLPELPPPSVQKVEPTP